MNVEQLTRLAQQTVTRVQKRLPPEIQVAAAAAPVSYQSWPNDELVADGLEPDILGLFVGDAHLDELGENPGLPPQIILFLENIWDLAEGDETTYCDEVRLTYLHELGHYLGWDEAEIARRGLE